MAAQQSPQQQGDNSLGPFWIIVGLGAFFWIVWHFGHVQITTVVLKLKLYEGYLISLFIPNLDSTLGYIKNSSPADMSLATLMNISALIGSYLRYPIAIIFLAFAAVIYFNNPLLRFKRTHTVQSLVETEKDSWPQIRPVVALDLVNTDIDQGPWAMALTPMQFAKKNFLLQEEHTISNDPAVLQFSKITASLRREEAYRVFSMQLGRYWQGVEQLPPHAKALFAIFAARANRDKDGAAKLLIQISNSVGHGKLNFAGAEALWEKHKKNKDVTKLLQNHAFVLTMMASMMVQARTDGVLATADFLWLKPLDRALWYMLNSVGRQTPFVEVAGPFAHWLAEKNMQRQLKVPMVDEAVNALEAAIKEVVYKPDDA